MIGRILQTVLVDFPVGVVADLLEQHPVMWAFIGAGWLCMLVMVVSIVAAL